MVKFKLTILSLKVGIVNYFQKVVCIRVFLIRINYF